MGSSLAFFLFFLLSIRALVDAGMSLMRAGPSCTLMVAKAWDISSWGERGVRVGEGEVRGRG